MRRRRSALAILVAAGLALAVAGGGAWLFFRWPARAVFQPGVADLVFQLGPDGKVTCNGKVFHDPPTRDFRKLEDCFESRRQGGMKGQEGGWRPTDFVDYTLLVDAAPDASWRQLFEVWSRAIRNGGVASAVLRVPDMKEEARVTFPRRKGPPPAGQAEVRLIVRDRVIDSGRSYLPIPYVEVREVATGEGAVGAFHPTDEAWNLSLARRAANRIMKEAGEAAGAGKPVRIVLDFDEVLPARRIVILLEALERAKIGDVELAEPRR